MWFAYIHCLATDVFSVPVIAVWGKKLLFIARTIRNTQMHSVRQNVEFYCVKAGCTYSNHWALNG
jgi:hypothetical protein